MLFEKDALVRNVLVDDAQTFAIHGHDKTVVHLPERLQIDDLLGAGKRTGRVRSFIDRRRGSWRSLGEVHCRTRIELQTLRNRLVGRAGQFKTFRVTCPTAKRRWDHCLRRAGESRSRAGSLRESRGVFKGMTTERWRAGSIRGDCR